MTESKKLKVTEISLRMKALVSWKRKGAVIHRCYEFKDFVQAMKFVTAVARAAESARHHPDIDIRWNRVTLALSTHDVGGLSAKDFDLAVVFDRLAAR